VIFIKSVFICFTIWVLAALVNALLAGTCLFIFSHEFGFWPEAFFIVLVFTLLFSVPGAFIFWIVLLINRDEAILFRILLKTGIVLSALSSLLLFIPTFYKAVDQPFAVSFCCVTAAITSVMVHHKRIVSAFSHPVNNDHV